MAASVRAADAQVPPDVKSGRPPSSLRFDWLMLAVSIWPLAGALTDAWAHINLPGLETFFTPWHAVLYSGLLAVAVCNGIVVARTHSLGYTWTRAVAPGYELTLVGIGILAVGGVSDLIWHTLFGIERNVSAIVSPTHVLVIVGILLIVAGPLRSAGRRPDFRALRGWEQLPLIISTLLAYTMITLVLQILNPFVYHWASAGDVNVFSDARYPIAAMLSQSLGLASILIQTALMMGFILPLVRRWQIVPGALTFLLTVNITLLGLVQQHVTLIPAALAAGIMGDLLLLALRPSATRVVQFRVFALALPVLLYMAYFVDLQLTEGIAWVIHLWIGSTVAAGVVGWGMSYLVVPSRPTS